MSEPAEALDFRLSNFHSIDERQHLIVSLTTDKMAKAINITFNSVNWSQNQYWNQLDSQMPKWMVINSSAQL